MHLCLINDERAVEPIASVAAARLVRWWQFGLEPDLRDFLPSPTAFDFQAQLIELVQADLDYRVWSRLLELQCPSQLSATPNSIVAELYHRSDWLGERLSVAQYCRLVAYEFQLYWNYGLCIAAADFVARLPSAWRSRCCDIRAAWNCPHCGQMDIPVLMSRVRAQAAHALCCPRPGCQQTYSVSDIYPPPHNPWRDSNAPAWLLEALADGPPQVGKAGSFGCAYLVADVAAHNRPTVVKVLHRRWCDSPEVIERFQRESKILALLAGQGTPHLYRAGILPNGQWYYQMQFIDGLPLRDLIVNGITSKLRDGSADDPLALVDLWEGVVHAMTKAHEHGIIHRDLSPQNIVITKQPESRYAVVLDWGQAMFVDGIDINMAGSPGFQAPELSDPVQLPTRAADVFALGSLLLYCLSGGERLPYRETRQQALMGDLGSEDSSRPASLLGRCNSTLNGLIEKLPESPLMQTEPELLRLCADCLAHEPTSRPQSAGVVALRMASWRSARQQRLEILPVIRSRNRLAWSLLTAVGIAALVFSMLKIQQVRAIGEQLRFERERTEFELRLAQENAEKLRMQELLIAEAQAERDKNQLLAQANTLEAQKATAFSELLLDLFKTADPLGFEGSGLREPSEAVQNFTALQLLQRAAARVSKDATLLPEVRMRMMDALGNALRGIADLTSAEPLLLQALELQNSATFQPQPVDLATVQFHLAMLYHDRRMLDRAQSHYTGALRLAGEHDLPVKLRNQIEFRYAWLLAELQAVDEAVELLTRIKKERTQTLGVAHPDVQLIEVFLMLVVQRNKKTHEVLTWLGNLPPSDSVIVELFKDYIPAQLLRRAQKYDAAMTAYEALLATMRSNLPVRHPLLGMVLADAAGLYREAGDVMTAIQYAEEAADVVRHTLPTHPKAVDLFVRLAEQYEATGQPSKADAIYGEVLGFLDLQGMPETSLQTRIEVESRRKSLQSKMGVHVTVPKS